MFVCKKVTVYVGFFLSPIKVKGSKLIEAKYS